MKKVSRRLPAALCLCALLCAARAASAQSVAQSPWEKPYDQWTQGEAEKILTDSPWAQTVSKGVALGYDNPVFEMGAQPTPEGVTIRLRSSPVIRLAMLRLRQIRANFDKMDEKGKAAFMEKNALMLQCPPCRDYYVVTMDSPPGAHRGVPVALSSMSFESLRQSVRLTDERGEKRELVHFEAPKAQGEEATFYFARLDEKGAPLLTTASKRVVLNFDPKVFGTAVVQITKIEFDVPKLILKGAVMF